MIKKIIALSLFLFSVSSVKALKIFPIEIFPSDQQKTEFIKEIEQRLQIIAIKNHLPLPPFSYGTFNQSMARLEMLEEKLDTLTKEIQELKEKLRTKESDFPEGKNSAQTSLTEFETFEAMETTTIALHLLIKELIHAINEKNIAALSESTLNKILGLEMLRTKDIKTITKELENSLPTRTQKVSAIKTIVETLTQECLNVLNKKGLEFLNKEILETAALLLKKINTDHSHSYPDVETHRIITALQTLVEEFLRAASSKNIASLDKETLEKLLSDFFSESKINDIITRRKKFKEHMLKLAWARTKN